MKQSKVFPLNQNRADTILQAAQSNIDRLFGDRKPFPFGRYSQGNENQSQDYIVQSSNKEIKPNNLFTKSLSEVKTDRISENDDEMENNTYHDDINNDTDNDDKYSYDKDENIEEYDENDVEFVNDNELMDTKKIAINPMETVESIQKTFKTLSEQIKEFKLKLMKSTEKLHEVEKTKAELEDHKYALEEENQLLKQKLIDTLEARQQNSNNSNNSSNNSKTSEIKYLLNDLMRKKKHRANMNLHDDNNNNKHYIDYGYDLLTKASLGAVDDLENSISYGDILTKTSAFLSYIKYWYKKLQPFKTDIRQVEGRLGSSVASYFKFQRFLFIQFTIIGIFVLAFGIYHFNNIYVRGEYTLLYKFTGFQPKFFLYSSFATNEASFYSWCLVGTVILSSFIGACKLGAWDFSLSSNDEIHDYSTGLTHAFSQLVDDYYAKGLKSKRTKQEEYILRIRRSLGFLFYLIVQATALSIIIYLNISTQTLSNFFGSYATIVLSLSLAFINIISPNIFKFITSFEKWDYPETEVNLLLVRMFLSSSLNLSVVILSYILLINPTLISTYTYVSKLQVTYSSLDFNCRLDQASAGIFILVLSNFIIHLITELGKGYLPILLKMTYKSYTFKKPEFELARSIVGLLDLIGKSFLLFPFNPLSIILLPFFIVIIIKWERYIMLNYYTKPKRPWKPQKAGQIFGFVYMSTMVIIAIPITIVFLVFKTLPKSCDIQDNYIDLCSSSVTENDGIYSCIVSTSSIYYNDFGTGTGSNVYPNNLCSTSCGAFVDSTSAFSPLLSSITSNYALNIIYQVLFRNPYIPWLLALLFLIYIAIEMNTIQVKVETHDSIEKVLETKIITLQAENDKQKKIIKRLKAIESSSQ